MNTFVTGMYHLQYLKLLPLTLIARHLAGLYFYALFVHSMRQGVLLAFFLILGISEGFGQNFNYVTYTTRDGLAGNMVYDMCQDSDGFLWFGTDNGLSRFDGKNFVNYTVKDGLMDNEVLHFRKDSSGRLWIGTFSHELVYYYRGKFHNRFNDTMLAKVSSTSRPMDLYNSADGSVWIVCQNQIFHWPKNGKLYEYDFNSTVKRSKNDKSFVFKQLWIGNKIAVSLNDSVYVIEGSRFYFHSIKKTKSGLREIKLINIRNDTIFFPIEHDIIRVTGNEFNPHLVATANGAYEVDTIESGIANRFLPDKSVTCAMKDLENNYWFSTLGDGVYKLASKTALTYSITDQLSAVNEVFSIGKRNDSVLTGHSGGQLAMWKKGKLKNVVSFQRYLAGVDNSISTNRLKAIVSLPGGGWILGFDGFLICQRGKTRKFLPIAATKTIDLINDTVALVATGQDVKEVNLNSFTVSKVVWFSRATSATRWMEKTIIGTLGGLKAPDSRELSALIEKAPVLNRRIIGLSKYKSSLWVATSDSGLIELNGKGIGRIISEKDGLPSNNCRTFFVDGDLMWIGTNKGLASFNLSVPSNEILIYNQYNLLPNDAISSVFVEGGEVYVGSPSGLTIFEPEKTNTASICRLSIDWVRSSRKEWGINDTIVLDYRDNLLQIKFAGISAKAAGNIDYYFLLKGLDEQWNSTKTNEITFSNLPPGVIHFSFMPKINLA